MEVTMAKNIQQIMDWYRQFNKSDILIKSKTHEFEIGINDRQLPHLLGLHYVSRSYLRGSKLYNHVKRLSDEDIFKRIEENHPDKLNMVKDRIQYFKYFMENLESAYLYEQSHPDTKIKSEFLLVDMEDGHYLHLGIGNNGLEDYLETFIVRHDDTYIKESQIKEQVEGLYRLDELMIPLPFSFDLEKNRILEEERRQKMEEVFYMDTDKDGLVDTLEQSIGTNPYAVDSDTDGLIDIDEFNGETDPKIPDKKQALKEVIASATEQAQSEDNYKDMKAMNNEREL